MTRLRDALACCLLALGCCAVAQVMFLLTQASRALSDAQEAAVQAIQESRALVRQQSDYHWDVKAAVASLTVAAKNVSDVTRNLNKTIVNADENLGMLAVNTDNRHKEAVKGILAVLQSTDKAVERVGADLRETNEQARLALAAAKGAALNVESLTGKASLREIPDNLARATAETHRATTATANAVEHIEHRLSPKKRGFWVTLASKIAGPIIVWLKE